MLFAVAAFLRPGAEAELIDHSDEFNEHLGPSARNLRVAGVLRDEEGKRIGYLAFVERDTMGEVQQWIEEGPIHQAGLSERIEIFEYQVEVGRLG